MAYNSPLSSTSSYGVVEVGANINVTQGVISLPQSVSTTSNIIFGSVTSTGAVTDSGNRVVTSVVPTAGTGIAVSSLVSTGTSTSWTITNIGVTSITAGTNITVSTSTGSVTISASVTPAVATTIITTANSPYAALATDYFIGVRDTVVATGVTIDLPAGANGETYIVKSQPGNLSDVTITPNGAETIEFIAGSYSITTATNGAVELIFNGTNWNAV